MGGVIIGPPRLRDDSIGIGIVIDDERRRQRREIGQRIGIFPDMGNFEPPPAPPSRRGDDDDDSDDNNGLVTFDM